MAERNARRKESAVDVREKECRVKSLEYADFGKPKGEKRVNQEKLLQIATDKAGW